MVFEIGRCYYFCVDSHTFLRLLIFPLVHPGGQKAHDYVTVSGQVGGV